MPPTYTERLPRASLWYRAWRYRRRTDPAEIAFLRRSLRPGQIAIDVGAHKGAYTYWMDARVGAAGHVYAFEPLPHLAGYLRRLQAAGALRHTTVEETALSDHAGEAELYMPEQGYQGTTTLSPQEGGHVRYRVRLETLVEACARLAARPVAFIKADIEGWELELFRGGEAVLRADRPVLLFECADAHRGGGLTARVFGYLAELGYEGWFFPQGRMAPLREFSVGRHQREVGPDWCMNFAFLPR